MLRQAYASSSRLIRPRRLVRLSSTTQPEAHPNASLLQFLTQELEQERLVSGNTRAYALAVNQVGKMTAPLQSAQEVAKIPRLTSEMKDKIAMWLEMNEHIDPLSPPPSERHIKALMQLPGIGRLRAVQLVREGATNVEDLRLPKFFDGLTDVQKAFLNFSEHIKQQADSGVASRIQECLSGAMVPTIEVGLVGDHRRGISSSPVTQLLVINPTHEYVPTPASTSGVTYYGVGKTEASKGNPTEKMVDLLKRRGILAADLRFSSHKWSGMLRIPTKDEDGEWEAQADRVNGVRDIKGEFWRADIVFAPVKSRGAAMLTTTGDEGFIRYVRNKAEERGLVLSEFGLWRLHSTDNKKCQQDPSCWELLPAESEEQILAELGIDWVEPGKRNFGFIEGKPTKRRKKY